MASRDKERYYWLKLDKGFFKRHDITVIEAMPNGKDYVLFYLKLMLESVDHAGLLRFSEMIPYDVNMLAAVTHTNVDVVRSAMAVLEELHMIEVLDDKTLYLQEVEKLLGSETFAALRKREQRDTGDKVPQLSPPCPQDIDIEIDTETDKNKRFKKPSLDEVRAYCQERGNKVDPEKFYNYYESVKWKVGKKKTMQDWKASVRYWETSNYGNSRYSNANQTAGGKHFNIVYD